MVSLHLKMTSASISFAIAVSFLCIFFLPVIQRDFCKIECLKCQVNGKNGLNVGGTYSFTARLVCVCISFIEKQASESR